MPEDQIGGEEHPGADRQAPLAPDAPTEAPILPPGQQPQHGHGVHAAKDRRSRWRGVAEAYEDARERDRERSQHRADSHPELGLQPSLHHPSVEPAYRSPGAPTAWNPPSTCTISPVMPRA